LNIARSRVRPSICNLVRIDHTCFGRNSPDRVDALVWAFTDLLVERMAGEGIYELYRQRAREDHIEHLFL
jgi:hypothetical protein